MADVIRIDRLEVDCVVGIHPHERAEPQPLVVDIELSLDLEPASRSERIRDTFDYTSLAAQMAFLLTNCHFRLLETAASVLARYLLSPPSKGERRPAIDRACVRLAKPEALPGRAIPSVKIDRPKEWVSLTMEERPFGHVDVIQETRDAGVYRLNVAPGRGIPLHIHHEMQEAEMILTSGLIVDGEAVTAGTIYRRVHGVPHQYENRTDRYQTILCVNRPSFIEADEKFV